MSTSNFYPFFSSNKLLMGCYHFEERLQNENLPRYSVNDCIDIVKHNAEALKKDIAQKSAQGNFTTLPDSTQFINASAIFIEDGATIEHCILNASEGPIYISKNVLVMDGATLRGPIFIGEASVIKMGATIYGGTSIGKKCIVGGEVKNTIINNYSNKAHHGYLGDSIIGICCNLGAGTSNSNIKNNAADIMLPLPAGECNAGQKFGLLMGDYCKAAINTSFNTGTIVGWGSNIFNTGLTAKLIAPCSWGNVGAKYKLEKLIDDNKKWLAFKGLVLSEQEEAGIRVLYAQI